LPLANITVVTFERFEWIELRRTFSSFLRIVVVTFEAALKAPHLHLRTAAKVLQQTENPIDGQS
jgi:hypothetical protein